MTLTSLLAAVGGALIIYLLWALGSWAYATFVRGVNLAPYRASGASPREGGKSGGGASWALVTGATDGIGLAFAHILAEEGLNVILVGRNEEKLAAVAQRLSPTGASIRYIVNDAALGSVDGIAEVVRQIIGDGPLTVLINNVGVGQGGRLVLHGLNEKDIRTAITVNCTFPALLTHAIVPLMVSSIGRHNGGGGAREQPLRGLIVNLSSVAALITNPLSSIYSATKAFNRQFSRALSSEYAGDGIDVLCTCPGFVASPMTMMSVSPICCTTRQCAQASLAKIGSIETIPHWKHGIMYLLVRCAYALIPTSLTPAVSFKATRLFRSKSDPRL